MRRARYTDDQIRHAVESADSIAGVLRALGIKPAGGSHFNISKRIRRVGLDTSHFTGQGHNRGRRLPRKPPLEILVRMPDGRPRTASRYLRRALLEIGRAYVCAVCGVGGTWKGLPLVLHVDHVDGDPLNCEQENLRFLCPNCHSQTPTYCRPQSVRNLSDS